MSGQDRGRDTGPQTQTEPRLQETPPPHRTAVDTDLTDRGFWHGRSGLVFPALLGAFMTFLLVGVLTMDVPEGTDFPGPRFFPILLIVAGYLLTALLVVHYLRHPFRREPDFGASSVNYDFAELIARAAPPS